MAELDIQDNLYSPLQSTENTFSVLNTLEIEPKISDIDYLLRLE